MKSRAATSCVGLSGNMISLSDGHTLQRSRATRNVFRDIAEDGEEEIDGKDKGEYASDRNNMVNS